MIWTKWFARLVASAALLIAGTAGAHLLTCDETFDGSTRLVVNEFPAAIAVSVTVHNTHPTEVSEALSIDSLLLSHLGAEFDVPMSLAIGDSTTKTATLHIATYEECRTLAALDGTDDGRLVAPITIEFDTGSGQCTAELICEEPICQPEAG